MIICATTAHKADWVELNQAFYREEQTGESDPRLKASDLKRHFEDAFDFLIASDASQLLLWYQAGVAAGFVTLVKYPSAWSGGWAIFVDDLYVLPQYRRQGIATAFFHYIDQCAEQLGARRIQLLVEPHNPAKALYHKQGFRGITLDFLIKHPEQTHETI